MERCYRQQQCLLTIACSRKLCDSTYKVQAENFQSINQIGQLSKFLLWILSLVLHSKDIIDRSFQPPFTEAAFNLCTMVVNKILHRYSQKEQCKTFERDENGSKFLFSFSVSKNLIFFFLFLFFLSRIGLFWCLKSTPRTTLWMLDVPRSKKGTCGVLLCQI